MAGPAPSEMKIPRRQPAAVAFDLDGVLVDTYRIWWNVLNAVRRRFGLKDVSEEAFQGFWGQGIEDDVRLLFPDLTTDEMVAAYEAEFPRHISAVLVLPGAKEMVERLRHRAVPMAVVTNCPRSIAEDLLRHAGLGEAFAALLTASDVEREKPAPDMVLEAARLLGVEPAELVVVGDTGSDRRAAEAAGARFVLFEGFEGVARRLGLGK